MATVPFVLAKIVDLDALWQTIWSATVAGVGISVVFAIAVLGATLHTDARRAGDHAASIAYAVMGAVGLALTAAAIVYGILLISG